MPSQISKVLCFDNASAERNQSNDKLESVREVLEIWNQYLQNGYIPDSCITADEYSAAFRVLSPIRVCISSKPRNIEKKFGAFQV